MSHHQKSQAKRVRMFRLIEEQEQSEESQIEFCKKQKLSIATFGYWRKKHKKYLAEKTNRKTTNFVPLKIKIKPVERTNTLLEVELPNQIILRCTTWSSENIPSLVAELYPIEIKKSSC